MVCNGKALLLCEPAGAAAAERFRGAKRLVLGCWSNLDTVRDVILVRALCFA